MNAIALHLPLALLALLSACAPKPANDDFSITGNTVQRVALDGATQVIVRCHCVTRAVRTEAGANAVVLRIAANYSSVGYHGRQNKPTQIDDERMRFAASRDGDALVLESHERTMMHHAFIVSRVDVVVPDGIEVRFEPIDGSALEGRGVR